MNFSLTKLTNALFKHILFFTSFWLLITLSSIIGIFSTEAHGISESIKPVIVATKEAPPFSMKTEEGKWTGISIDLWRMIAETIEIRFEFKEFSLQELLDKVSDQKVDLAVAAITVTPEREKHMNFSHPYFTTGLGIAVPLKQTTPWLSVIQRFFALDFLKVVLALGFLLLLVGMLVWLFERKNNPEQFGGSVSKGVGSAFWWSAVTMTTVGYGDKAPKTPGGRLVALIWMFASIIVISSFTASITSSLTIQHLESSVKSPSDLPNVLIGAVGDTTGEIYLKNNQLRYQTYPNAKDGLIALARGEVEAMVYDKPILRYYINKEFNGKLKTLPSTFVRQDYSIAIPDNSPLRERINQALLAIIKSEQWQETVQLYLGK